MAALLRCLLRTCFGDPPEIDYDDCYEPPPPSSSLSTMRRSRRRRSRHSHRPSNRNLYQPAPQHEQDAEARDEHETGANCWHPSLSERTSSSSISSVHELVHALASTTASATANNPMAVAAVGTPPSAVVEATISSTPCTTTTTTTHGNGLAEFWTTLGDRIRHFERALQEQNNATTTNSSTTTRNTPSSATSATNRASLQPASLEVIVGSDHSNNDDDNNNNSNNGNYEAFWNSLFRRYSFSQKPLPTSRRSRSESESTATTASTTLTNNSMRKQHFSLDCQRTPFLKTASSFERNGGNLSIPTICHDEIVMPGSTLQAQMAIAAAKALEDSHNLLGEECVICMDGFDPTNPRMPTLCGCGENKTFFHLPCLYQWMEQTRNCPSCRQPLQWEEL